MLTLYYISYARYDARYLIDISARYLYCINFYVVVYCVLHIVYLKLRINTTSKSSKDSESAVRTKMIKTTFLEED